MLNELSKSVIASAASGGGGCGCKIGAADLLPILKDLHQMPDDDLLIGAATTDDAAVYRLRDDLAIVQTIDFFPPPVADPYDFGRIAAANALSDIYAMSGTPLTALNVVCMPEAGLTDGSLEAVLKGGIDVCSAANVTVAGGHSIRDEQPKFGLAVTGLIHPDEILANSGARAGDVLVLTKPLGTAAILRGFEAGLATERQHAEAVETMAALNLHASKQALLAGATAMTDVTGFGLLGHLQHVCRESSLSAVIHADSVPRLDGADQVLTEANVVSGGTLRNIEWSNTFTKFAPTVSTTDRLLLAEATTSGGLLVAVPHDHANDVDGAIIGELVNGEPGAVVVS